MSALAFDKLIALIASLFGLAASMWGFFSWLRTAERKRLESERQLAHALNNFASVSDAIAQLQEQMESMTLELAQIKTLLSIAIAPPTGQMNSAARGRR